MKSPYDIAFQITVLKKIRNGSPLIYVDYSASSCHYGMLRKLQKIDGDFKLFLMCLEGYFLSV